jgi:conjugative transfer ATPase
MPASDARSGTWYFDGRPHTCVTLQRLLKSPQIGHLSAERALGSRLTSLWDRFPEGTCMVLTVVAKPQDQIIEHLDAIDKRAVGASAEARRARTEIERARQEITRSNKLYPTNIAIYLAADDLAELRRSEDRLNALLLAEGLQPISREHDLIRLDAYVRNLPANFDPDFDRQTRWARLQYSDHLARLLPLYGRGRGTGRPGILAYNRGGEPFTFDPLSRLDRRKNAHALIVGPPGSGKSSFLLATLTHQIAIRKPRLFLTEVGRSFELFADYLQEHGVSVKRLMLSPEDDVRLPLFQDALTLKPADLDETQIGDDWETEDDDNLNRDVLAEMELAAALMVTGGEAREVERMKRADRRLLQRAIIGAGVAARNAGKTTVLTEDVARALHDLHGLEGARRERALDMADCLELYTEGFTGRVFNRAGEHWSDADVIILNLGLFANEGYEDKLALSVIGLVNHVNSLAERTRYDDRQIILCFDEAHIVTTHPLLAPYLTKASKVWGRRYAVWLWLATQNMEDFPAGANRLLNTLEWWIALYMPPEEIEQLARFRDLTTEQKALLQAVRKEPGKYTEGVLLHDEQVALFRNVPPPLMLALAQTEQHERVERARIMREQGCSELEAAQEIARRIATSRGGAESPPSRVDGTMGEKP